MSTSTAVANAELAKLLSDNEDYVLSLLKSKAVDLSEKMFRNVLISDSMMDKFSSLDHSRVEHQLQLRYLLRLVTQRIQQDESDGDRFLSLLEIWREQPLCEYLKRNSSGEEQPEAERNRLDDRLSSDDIAWLLELLIDASHKWDDLAIALGFRMYQRNNIEGDNNVDKLKKVSDVWLSGGSTTPPTVNTLTAALRSKLVGQGRLALELEEQHKASTTANKASNIKIHHSTNFPFATFYQSPHKVEVEDGKSTILFTQVSNRENVSYQWNKNGQALVDKSSSNVADHQHYFGVHEDILFINHAHQGTQGEYTCCVSYEERQVVSNKVTLTVLYTPEKKVLLDKYSSVETHKVPLDEAWPPVGAETFIKLVLIKSSELAINSSSYSIDKNPDKVIDNNKELEYKDAFTAYRSASFLLIEGRPGSGKTTLVCKLIKDWTEGIALVKAKLVFLVSLRMLNNDHSQKNTLSEILQQFYSPCATLNAVVLNIEKNNGEGVCFVFDGLDEYHPDREEESIVFRILHRHYLSQAMIIVSSRPEAKERLRMAVVKQHIEVLGFTENQISEYIDNFPFDSSSGSSFGSSELKAYLRLHPNVLHMCSLPIHAAIICFVYNIKRGHLPHTQTKIYDEFTKSMILRHLKRNSFEVQLHSLKELPDDVRECFSKLCLLAFDMTVEFKQVINSNEITFPLNRDSFRGDWSLGLVTCNRTAQLSGVSTSYMFLHLTLQEYLAAYYITGAKQEKKRQLIQKLISKSHFAFESVWTFCFGLETFQSQTKLDTYQAILKTNFFRQVLFRYAFESQEQIVCDEVVRLSYGHICIYNLRHSDVPAATFIISKAAQSIRLMELRECDGVIAELLFEQIRHVKFPELETLTIYRMSVSAGTLQHLLTILESCGNLRDLILYLNSLSKEGGDIIANSLKYINQLKYLGCCPSERISQSSVILTIIKHIHCLTQLDILDLSGWKLDPQFCKVLASNICHLTSLKQLNLIWNDIRSDGAISLASVLHHITQLQILKLSQNKIGVEGAISLASALHPLTELKTLDLSHITVGAVGATSLAPALRNLTKLVSLHMRETAIGSEGAISLASVLPHLTKLENLLLESNNIGSDGATALASGLCHLTEVKLLSLSGNDIDAHSAILIIKALKDCQKLECVMLNKNITYDGRSDKGVHLKGLITSDVSATMDDFVAAARLHKRDIDLHLGFKTINIQHKFSSNSLQ